MQYIIVPTSNSDYQSWQCKLLNWSRKKVKQQGRLIFLRCDDEMGIGRPLDTFADPDVTVIDLPDYALNWEYAEEEARRGEKYWWGAIPNKYMSVKWLCDNNYFQDDDVLLFLDPDMIFLEPITYQPEDNEVIAQRFIHYTPLEGWIPIPNDQYGWGIMYPFCMKFKTLKTIIHDYVSASEGIRRQTKRWEAEMWGLDYAVKKNNLKITYVEDFGYCTAWKQTDDIDVSKIVHFPNELLNRSDKRIWFKQDYTTNPTMTINPFDAKNEIEKRLLLEVSQQRSDYLYHLKWNVQDIFKFYNGSDGYCILKPWAGGFNNIRMSLELAVCFAYLTNKILVLPPKYQMYLLKEEFGLEDFFDIEDIGVKTISFEEFCKLKGIEPTWKSVDDISGIVTYGPDFVFNMEEVIPPQKFVKGRNVVNKNELPFDVECVFFDSSLLGNFYQTIYTSRRVELNKLIAKHVHYKKELFDLGWQAITWLGDQQYYAIHIRRNDFQYKHLFITAEEILDNIKGVIPFGAKLYVATDNADKEFFRPLAEHYQLYFYEDVASAASLNPHYNYIPIIEQLICTRAIKFVGNDYSTLSSYIYRLRGYMGDISDKNFYINTSTFLEEHQSTFLEASQFVANWAREFKDAWDFDHKTIFVSVASYDDTQLIPTLVDLYETAQNVDRIRVGVHIQHDQDYYDLLLKKNFPNMTIIYTPKEQSKGVVWARERIKDELYRGEHYFFQIDAHSRFKVGWDSIMINQYETYAPNREKILFSTYPNHFELFETKQQYTSRTPTNAPLVIKGFFTDEFRDNRLHTRNLGAMKPREIINNRWIAGGFIFAPSAWLVEIPVPYGISSKGEEDTQLFLSYLNGWDIKLSSEAVVWHNYNVIDLDGSTYRRANHNSLSDNSIEVVNRVLFGKNYSRSIDELENYLSIKFKKLYS